MELFLDMSHHQDVVIPIILVLYRSAYWVWWHLFGLLCCRIFARWAWICIALSIQTCAHACNQMIFGCKRSGTTQKINVCVSYTGILCVWLVCSSYWVRARRLCNHSLLYHSHQ